MEVGKHNAYTLKIVDSSFQCTAADGEQGRGFLPSDVLGKLPKLYVVKHGGEVCYVGITKQDIRTRLRYGLNAKGENGYWGYKWRGLDEVELLIWTFPESEIGNVEAIEGELVFLIRQNTGRWPLYQMEIHFHPAATESEKVVAQAIYEKMA